MLTGNFADKDQFIIQIPSIVETVEAVANRAACDGFEVPAFDELLKVLMNECEFWFIAVRVQALDQ